MANADAPETKAAAEIPPRVEPPRPARAELPRFDAPGSRVARRSFVNEMPDRGLFIIVSMAGFASIVAAKLNGINSNYVAAGAVGLMLVYAVIAFRIPRLRLRPDRLGDNFYYLGFIFTLASLSAALIELSSAANQATTTGESAQLPIDRMLGSFGIALVTTIVGVAGRVMFVQMRGEMDEIEAGTRRNLLDTSEALRGQLMSTLTDFRILQTSLQQVSDEIVGSATSLAQQQIAATSHAASALSGAIERSFANGQGMAEGINATLAQTSDGLARLVERLDAMQLPSERMEDEMARLGQNVDDLVVRLQGLVTEVTVEKRRRGWSVLRWLLI